MPVLRRTEVWAAIWYLLPPSTARPGCHIEQNNIANSCGRAFTTESSEHSEPHRMPSRLWVPADVLQPRQPLLPPPSAPRGRHGPAGSVLASVGEPVDDPKGGEETGTRTCGNHQSRQRAWTGRGRGAGPLIGPRSAVRRPSVVAKIRPAQKAPRATRCQSPNKSQNLQHFPVQPPLILVHELPIASAW